jgi:hypothetical protein
MTRYETPRALRGKTASLSDVDQVLRYIAKSTSPDERIRLAEREGASPRVLEVLTKADVAAGATSTLGNTAFGPEMGALYSQARNIGVADAMAQFALRLPVSFGRFNIMSSVTASTVAEGAGKPVRALDLSTTDISASKGVAQVVLTREVLDGIDSANIMTSIRNELMRSIVYWTDSLLLTQRCLQLVEELWPHAERTRGIVLS